MSLTETDIQKVVAQKFCLKKRHELTVPNIKTCHGWWEADLLSLTRSYMTHEFEIKTSTSDLLKELSQIDDPNSSGCKRYRNEAIVEQLNESQDLKETPNYFWYVLGPKVKLPSTIPDYAGIIRVIEFGNKQSIKEVRKATQIHKFKASDHIILSMARSLNFKAWDYKMWETKKES